MLIPGATLSGLASCCWTYDTAQPQQQGNLPLSCLNICQVMSLRPVSAAAALGTARAAPPIRKLGGPDKHDVRLGYVVAAVC